MLFEDLEYIINGCHYMTEDELQEFIQTRSPLKQGIMGTVGQTGLMGRKAIDYQDRKDALLKQREMSPRKRQALNIKTKKLRRAGIDASTSPEERRGYEDYKRPEKFQKYNMRSKLGRARAKQAALKK